MGFGQVAKYCPISVSVCSARTLFFLTLPSHVRIKHSVAQHYCRDYAQTVIYTGFSMKMKISWQPRSLSYQHCLLVMQVESVCLCCFYQEASLRSKWFEKRLPARWARTGDLYNKWYESHHWHHHSLHELALFASFFFTSTCSFLVWIRFFRFLSSMLSGHSEKFVFCFFSILVKGSVSRQPWPTLFFWCSLCVAVYST